MVGTKTNKPVIGVLPYLHGFDLEAEDAINSSQVTQGEAKLNVVVPVFPRISNHTDFDILRSNPDINLRYVGPGERLDRADLIVLPGSKSVRNDLAHLREQGWDKDIARHIRLGGKVMGICGGYQMLGKSISDPLGIEGEAGSSDGLGYLDLVTELAADKTLTNVVGTMTLQGLQTKVKGYEIHAGVTQVNEQPLMTLSNGQTDGAISDCNQVIGTYLHGIFDASGVLNTVANWVIGDNVTSINHTKIRKMRLIESQMRSKSTST